MAKKEMKVGPLTVHGSVVRPPKTPTSKIKDFGFTGGNVVETSRVSVSNDAIVVVCESHSNVNRMYVDVSIKDASIRVYRLGKKLVVQCDEGEIKDATCLTKTCFEVVPG